MHWSGARRSRFGRDGECSQGSLEGESRGCAKPGFICNHRPDNEVTFEEHLWHELSLLWVLVLGDVWESIQYSGRENADSWKCPFHFLKKQNKPL